VDTKEIEKKLQISPKYGHFVFNKALLEKSVIAKIPTRLYTLGYQQTSRLAPFLDDYLNVI
jgi:hypothetical protein